MLTVSSTTTVRRSPEDVFELVSDPVNDTKWHHNVTAARRVSDGALEVGTKIHWDVDFLGKREADVEMTRYEPPRRAAYSVKSGRMRVVVSYEVEAVEGGTRLTRAVGIPLPAVARPLHPLIRWQAARSGQHHIDWLRDILEGREAGGHGHGHQHHGHQH